MKKIIFTVVLFLLSLTTVFAEFNLYVTPNLGFSHSACIDTEVETDEVFTISDAEKLILLAPVASYTLKGVFGNGLTILTQQNYQIFPFIKLTDGVNTAHYNGPVLGGDMLGVIGYTHSFDNSANLTVGAGFALNVNYIETLMEDGETLVKDERRLIYSLGYGGSIYLGFDYMFTENLGISISVSDMLCRSLAFTTGSESIIGFSNTVSINLGLQICAF